MRRGFFLLALALCVWADVKTHMTLPVELGVNQLRENFETDIVTFYAVVRSVENNDYRWILSLVNFTCDGSCAESTSNFCESTPKLNPGWESHKLDSYPHEGDPPAVHLRRSLEIDGEFACQDGIEWEFDEATSVATLSGQLFLHTINGCDDSGCPILVSSDILPFEVSYNTESGALDGLVSRDMTYVYDIFYRRNLWLSGYDTLVELASTVQTLGDRDAVAVPMHFENPVISSQTMQPEMKIVGLTECVDNMQESGCQQNWYLQAASGTSQPAPLIGEMEITADLLFSDGTIVQSLLHLNIDVQSPNDPGQTWRAVDALTSVRGQPYFSGMLNPTAIVKGDRICVSVSAPDHSSLNPGAVRICASQKVDLVPDVSPLAGCRTNIDDLVVYEIMNVATGAVNASFNPSAEQSADHEYKVCFDAIPLSEKIEVVEVYFTKTSTASVTTSRKRQDGDLYVAQGVPVGCSWSESWDPVVCRCVPYETYWDNDDWDWLWVFFLVFIFILIIGVAAVACCYYPDYGTCRYPMTYCEAGRTYVITKNPDGSTSRSVVLDGNNNNVTYNSAETASMSNFQKVPTKKD